MWLSPYHPGNRRNGLGVHDDSAICGEWLSEEVKETGCAITYIPGSSLIAGCKGPVSEKKREMKRCNDVLTLPNIRVSSRMRCEVNITMK